ncbi:tetratricopeptide repeat protein [Flavobacterium ovatum]|uniref:tetratricopeptide repeat protein n=1 Tax=Flavobacterium ovatum TaxID=1928857 RepID=UPI00344E82AB
MKNIFLLLSLFNSLLFFGQDKLVFDTKFTQSEDKWVAFPADSTGAYGYGFIYIDLQAGLTLDYAGKFKIGSDGKFESTTKAATASMKYRLQPNNTLVAVIPDSHFAELKLAKFPDWLKIDKGDEKSIGYFYKLGYIYNGLKECQKGLELLQKAEKIDPDYKGLRVELAFSYNCLGNFEKSIAILKMALKKEPNNAYINKELIYSQINNNQIEIAITTYEKSVTELLDKTYNSENSFNILGAFYRKGNLDQFNKWIEKTKIDEDQKFKGYIAQMKNELEKK